MDLDVEDDFTRIELAGNTLRYLVEKKAKIIVIGHKGRPEGKTVPGLSLRYVTDVIARVAGSETVFCDDIIGEKAKNETEKLPEGSIVLLENLRFNPGEESNDPDFIFELAALGELYVNEAFAVCHREHASIVALPLQYKSKSKNSVAAGIRLEKEVSTLSGVWDNPDHPIVAVISGVKEDKMKRIENIVDIADKILVGGLLPKYYGDDNPNPDKIIIGQLITDTQDLTIHTIEKFKGEIATAKTIILAGVPGKYEDEGHRQGTKEIFEAIANSKAFKIAGGGDAEAAITLFGLNNKFDWISVGGGAMLEFLAKRTLPGIEALRR